MGGKYSYPQRHFETIHSFTSYTAGNYKRTRKTAALETNLSTLRVVLTKAILFLKSMSERVGSDTERF